MALRAACARQRTATGGRGRRVSSSRSARAARVCGCHAPLAGASLSPAQHARARALCYGGRQWQAVHRALGARARTSAEGRCTLASPVGLPCELMPRCTLPSPTETPTEWKKAATSCADARKGSPRILITCSPDDGAGGAPEPEERASAARASRPPEAAAERADAPEGGELAALAEAPAPRETPFGCEPPAPLAAARAPEPPAAGACEADARLLVATGASVPAPTPFGGGVCACAGAGAVGEAGGVNEKISM